MECHAALDRNQYPSDLYSACPHRQFHKLPGFLHSQAALPNSYPNACVRQVLQFFDGLWYDSAGRESSTYRMRGRHANH